ncbi:DUF3841 domain-containing protein [uncultured Limosilactobacillus sp.]|uniref:DUF3841 domain-containing protein n=1 Tax=uncultured Limosilactobacillus sp. TaxID=2837629 RepID=UPI0025D613B3|nr:DUF3841 domain-containing protein [uncultured Limosilactobacillus sp.]
MIVWSIQPYEVYEQLLTKGTFICDPAKSINLQSDLEFNVHDFENAYNWMIKQMNRRIGNPPNGVTLPVWVWYKYNYSHRHPDFRTYRDYDNQVCLELNIPENQILLSDYDNWHFVLNDWYLNDAKSDEEWHKKDDWFDNLSPLKQKRVKERSWQRIFDVTPRKGEWTQNGAFVQGCCWYFKKDQISHVWYSKKGQRCQQIL